MRIRTAAVAVVLTAGGLVGLAAPAAASCATFMQPLREGLAEARYIFVGTVVETTHGDRNAQVAVESVWRGDVSDTVEVRGGPGAPDAMTSIDREFMAGQRYLFVPDRKRDDVFLDNNCTKTQPWKARFERLRPDDARDVAAPATEGASDRPTPIPIDASSTTATGESMRVPAAAIAAAAALVLGAVALLRRRHRSG